MMLKTLLVLTLPFSVIATLSQPCPDLTLPWTTIPGNFNNNNNVCVYSDVRFASPPVGKLRFAAPEYPPATSNGSAPPAPVDHPSCIQMKATPCSPGGPIGANANCFPDPYGTQNEDCLFLDIYVPIQAFNASKPSPVVVWIYGGGYVAGSKTQFDPAKLPFYDGDGVINAASSFGQESVIFVAGNYRLGAFGWLAGSYMEQNGQPNAGLLDQRTVLQFVQDHISLVNGDSSRVSAWGESAGASSIMHHLTMPENIQKPLFKKAILQSPAYQWLWNRTGALNDTFTEFAERVGKSANCSLPDINCLRSANTTVLADVNQKFGDKLSCDGIMPFGPAVDGNIIPDLAPVQFKAGKVTPIDSIVVSHVDLEIKYTTSVSNFSFIPRPIRAAPNSEAATNNFLEEVFRGDQYGEVRQKIVKQYPSSKYKDQIARAAAVITDRSFTCNTRFIMNYYIQKAAIPVYAMDYAVLSRWGGAVHGTDLLPLFANKDMNYTKLIQCVADIPEFEAKAANKLIHDIYAGGMQRAFTNHAIYGDPNHKNAAGDSPIDSQWSPATIDGCSKPADSNQCVRNLMKPHAPLNPWGKYWGDNAGPDLQTSDDICQFWDAISQEVSSISHAKVAVETETSDDAGVGTDQLVLNYEL